MGVLGEDVLIVDFRIGLDAVPATCDIDDELLTLPRVEKLPEDYVFGKYAGAAVQAARGRNVLAPGDGCAVHRVFDCILERRDGGMTSRSVCEKVRSARGYNDQVEILILGAKGLHEHNVCINTLARGVVEVFAHRVIAVVAAVTACHDVDC